MRNLAVFCDGTWQYFDQAYPTNVALLFKAVADKASDGTVQLKSYDDGVGVAARVDNPLEDLAGGAFGEGLDRKVIQSYRWIAQTFQPGDRIFLFGFSRGAFTARSLGGLLRWAWIPRPEHIDQVDRAMALYRSRPNKGAAPADEAAFQARMAAFRAAYCYASQAFTGLQAYDPTDPSTLTPNDPTCAWLQYVGVFDTVGSLGVPDDFPLAGLIDAQYQFYDTSLSRFVRSARHAVSIDEQRETFKPTLWDNIDDLNTNAGATMLAYDLQPYQQRWFPGGHGAVGGGGDDGGISIPPLLWIAEGANRAGLTFDPAAIQGYLAKANPAADFQKPEDTIGSLLVRVPGMADRDGPGAFDEVSLSARLRFARRGDYRPHPLSRAQTVAAALAGFDAPPDPQGYYLAD